MDATEAFVMYANFRIQDKVPTMETYQKIADHVGASASAIRVRAKRERWEEQVSRLLPSLVAKLPTTTTAVEIVDEERRTFLEVSRKMVKHLHEFMDYYHGEFEEAKANNNPIMASEMIEAAARLSLYAIRAQQISQNACCDSGSATVPSENPQVPGQGDAINLFLSPFMATPRIPQPEAAPMKLKIWPENGSPP